MGFMLDGFHCLSMLSSFNCYYFISILAGSLDWCIEWIWMSLLTWTSTGAKTGKEHKKLIYSGEIFPTKKHYNLQVNAFNFFFVVTSFLNLNSLLIIRSVSACERRRRGCGNILTALTRIVRSKNLSFCTIKGLPTFDDRSRLVYSLIVLILHCLPFPWEAEILILLL